MRIAKQVDPLGQRTIGERPTLHVEESVRSIEQEGLVWGASTLVAIGYGIKKLQITLVIGG